MSNTNTGGPAFPQVSIDQNGDLHQPGLSMRDYFAAKAMQGLLADQTIKTEPEEFAYEAYNMADAMLKARQS
jgi:hypothetical protein